MPKISVKRPFTVLVVVLAVIIMGIVSVVKMQLDLLPQISLPYMMVITTYPGASSQKVEEEVCKPLESALGIINGVENIYSVCSENYGMVQLEFQDDIDMDSAMVKVSSALNTVIPGLPEECGTPSIIELSTDMMASEYLAVAMEGMSMEQLSQFVENDIRPAFERQNGVASVSSLGLIEKTISVELNKEKVEALNDKILAIADDAFADAVKQLDDAKKQLQDSEKTIRDSKSDLVDAQKELEDGRKELEDGKKEIADGYNELADGQVELDNGKKALEDGAKELQNQQDATYKGLAAASEALDQLNSYKTQLDNQKYERDALNGMVAGAQFLSNYSAITGSLASVPDGKALGESGMPDSIISSLAQALQKENDDVKNMNKAQILAALELLKATLEAQGIDPANIDSYQTRIDELNISIAVTEQVISGYESQLKGTNYADIEKGKLDAATGFANGSTQIQIGQLSLASAQAQLDAARKQLDTAKDQLEKGEEQLVDGQDQINEGWKQLRDGEEKLSDGWEDYNKAVRQYEKQKKEALKKANANQLLTLSTLAQLVYAQNFAMPAGYVDDKNDDSWLIEVGDNFESIKELEDSVLAHIDDVGDVKLIDVADIQVLDNSLDSYVRLDGEQAIILSIFKSSTSGTNAVSQVCQNTIDELMAKHPGLNIMIMMDQGEYIKIIVNSVVQSMLIGAALAIIILAIFLKDVKPTVVVAISIPLSVLLAVIAMYFSGISLNMLSLSGLALGIGMLVDNSIVVMENIYRLRSRGIPAPRAAVQGAKQVAGAIISSTLTTVCVFLPMIYTSGMVRELMMPMCLSIIYCLMASLLVAMTVVPASSSTILKNATPKEHPLFDKVMVQYEKLLRFCLKLKVVPLGIAVGLLALTLWLVLRMGIVMIPEMTANQIEATLTIDEKYNREESYALADRAIEEALQVDGIGSIGVMTGNGTQLFVQSSSSSSDFRSYSFMILTEDEKAGEAEIKRMTEEMEERVNAIEGVELSVSTAMGEMSQMFGSGLAIQISGSDLDEDLRISRDIMEIIEGVEGFTNISNGEEDADSVVHIKVDKNKAMSMGLSVAQIYADLAGKITTSVDSVTVSIDGIDMKVKISDEMDPLTKENIMDRIFTVDVKDEDGDQITEDHKLSDFAEVVIRDGVSTINRENQNRYITVTADVKDGYNTTLLARELLPLIEAYKVPAGYTVDMGGEYETVTDMLGQMLLVGGMGAAFIYFVMVAQFQSLLSPFIIMFTIPLAFTGGFASLFITGEHLSVLSLLGIVVLMGTVVNNGIVFVDYVNQLRIGGLSRVDALVAAGKTRMRPILMTALTTILAESNLMFGDDMGAQMGKGMALVIAGGLAYATLMTLFIIPVMYDLMFKKQPLDIDIGMDNLDDIPDDAAEYMQSMQI